MPTALMKPENRSTTMNRMHADRFSLTSFLPRAAMMLAVVAAPLLAINAVQANSGSVIESSYRASSGAGLVLVVGLQRG